MLLNEYLAFILGYQIRKASQWYPEEAPVEFYLELTLERLIKHTQEIKEGLRMLENNNGGRNEKNPIDFGT